VAARNGREDMDDANHTRMVEWQIRKMEQLERREFRLEYNIDRLYDRRRFTWWPRQKRAIDLEYDDLEEAFRGELENRLKTTEQAL
jgi:hypothetical protein